MRIVLFANHELALPAIFDLIGREMLAGLVTPNVVHDATVRIREIAKVSNIPYIAVDRKAVHDTLPGWLKDKNPDAVFVMTFSFKLPESILSIPKYGCFNWHTGILPEYRGPDPVFWEFVNGEKEGGVTLHRMNREFDEGPIIKIEKIPIVDGQTHGEHYKKISEAVMKLLEYILDMLVIDPLGIVDVPQDESKGRYYKRPEVHDLFINWKNDDARRIMRLVMAANPLYGGARTIFRKRPLHIFQVTLGKPQKSSSGKPGRIIAADSKDGFVVISRDGVPIRLEVFYCEEGFYSGPAFIRAFNVRCGEEMQDIREGEK